MQRAVLLFLILLVAGCASPQPSPTPAPTASTESTAPSTLPADCRTAVFAHDLNATIVTSKGSIGAVLYAVKSPITVCNFLRYVREDFYDDTIWHRICPHVIQTGGYNPYTMQQKATHAPIPDEATISQLRNYRGTLGMARESDPDTATSHFFINNRDNLYLDFDGQYAPGYAVFGNVTSGWDVERDIADTQTLPEDPVNGGCMGVPVPTDQTTILDVVVG